MKSLFVVCSCLALAVPLAAQNSDGPATTFKSGVDLVALNVVVTDSRQKFVAGLQADNFAVFEDGVQQSISFFAANELPLDLALLLDTSASMTDKMATMQQAAIGFAHTLRPSDRISIVDIKDKTTTLYPLGDDIPTAIKSIKATRANGGTSIYNALYITLRQLAQERRAFGDLRRQAIAVLSDGDDTASLVTFDDVMELAKQSGIAIYTITLKGGALAVQDPAQSRFFSQNEFSMKSLAQETGGRFFFPTQIGELAGIYSVIAEELANQYAIGYTSKNQKRDGVYRRLLVRVDRPETRTRARAGYLAGRGMKEVQTP